MRAMASRGEAPPLLFVGPRAVACIDLDSDAVIRAYLDQRLRKFTEMGCEGARSQRLVRNDADGAAGFRAAGCPGSGTKSGSMYVVLQPTCTPGG
jgi:hypothetical protein